MNNKVWTPALKDFAQPRGGEEAVSWSFYHMRRQALGAFPASQQFFNVGKGGTDGAVSASELETNMEKASSITAPKRMLVTGINLMITGETAAGGLIDAGTADETVDSIQQAIDGLVFGFYISDKKYLEVPASFVPAGAGLSGFAGTTTNTEYVTSGVPSVKNNYSVLLPIPFEFAFYALITNPKGFTTTAALRMTVALHGILVRPKQ